MMEKIMTFTDEQFKKLQRTKQTKWLKEILGIPLEKKYAIGDTAVLTGIEGLKENDVLKAVHREQDHYYIVAAPMGGTVAFCFSVYPI